MISKTPSKIAKIIKKCGPIKDDKFLTYVVKKDFRGKVDKTKLEQIFFSYIAGDKDMEKKYLKIK